MKLCVLVESVSTQTARSCVFVLLRWCWSPSGTAACWFPTDPVRVASSDRPPSEPASTARTCVSVCVCLCLCRAPGGRSHRRPGCLLAGCDRQHDVFAAAGLRQDDHLLRVLLPVRGGVGDGVCSVSGQRQRYPHAHTPRHTHTHSVQMCRNVSKHNLVSKV